MSVCSYGGDTYKAAMLLDLSLGLKFPKPDAARVVMRFFELTTPFTSLRFSACCFKNYV
jgi:hypothetical protein